MNVVFERGFWVVHLVFLGLCAHLVAGAGDAVAGHMLREPPKAKASKSSRRSTKTIAKRDYEIANMRNLFGAKRESLVPPPPDAKDTAAVDPKEQIADADLDFENAPQSSLRARLVGTAVFSFAEDSLASIIDLSDGKKAVAKSYSINACPELPTPVEDPEDDAYDPDLLLIGRPQPCNNLMDAGVIKRIDEERVYLVNNDTRKLEYIAINEEPPGGGKRSRKKKPKKGKKKGKSDVGKGIKKTGEGSYEVKQEEIDGALNNLSSLATQARIVPAFESGKAIGFKLFSIKPNSLYSKIGIKNGDVVTRINGYEINSPDKALELYQRLKDSKSISVDLKRRGSPVTLDYAVVP